MRGRGREEGEGEGEEGQLTPWTGPLLLSVLFPLTLPSPSSFLRAPPAVAGAGNSSLVYLDSQ